MTVIDSIKSKASTAAASAGEINKLTIDKAEEMAKINLATVGYFSDIGIKQMRAISGIKDKVTDIFRKEEEPKKKTVKAA